MSIPKYNEIMPYALKHIAANGMQNWRHLEQPLAEHFGLSEEDVNFEYASGNGTVFLDRISWALSYLSLADLVERPKRGFYQVTSKANDFIDNPAQLNTYVKTKIAERDAERLAKKLGTPSEGSEGEELILSETTPQEQLDAAYSSIRKSTYDAVLDLILSKTPVEFEKLVVSLLEKMGYGGQVINAGQVTQASNDGGIDGIIKEDILGLGRIHIQAKRYAKGNAVGREEVQKFVGALAVAQSNKGVFITTSSYSSGAIKYSESLNGSTNLVLIDGEKLAEYIYDYDLGMHTEQTIKIKQIDADFWDRMQNNSPAVEG